MHSNDSRLDPPMYKYVDVAIPLGVRKTFAYSVPASLREKVAIGSRVLVPFGRKMIAGFIVGILNTVPEGGFQIRAVRDVLDAKPAVPAALVETALWIADYYFTPPGEVLRLMMPVGSEVEGVHQVSLSATAQNLLLGGLRLPSLRPAEELLLDILARDGPMNVRELASRAGLKDITESIESLSAARYILLDTHLSRPRASQKARHGIRALVSPPQSVGRLTEQQERLYSQLQSFGEAVLLTEALKMACCGPAVAKSLIRKGLAEIVPLRIERVPIDLSSAGVTRSVELTQAQWQAFSELRQALHSEQAARFLLHGVTGSGKTEIYLRLIKEVLDPGGRALMLVPEIGLTPLLSRTMVSRFPGKVALIHSAMSMGERFDQWNRIRSGELPVVVGTRSAVFAPLENLRLAIIDEEQDASYKQDEVPCYHAREVAWHRVQQTNGLLLLGSATPSIETYHAAVNAHGIRYLSLPERIESRPLPDVTITDMSVEFQRHGKNSVISAALLQGLRETLRRREQAIILLNRRGYSRSLLCRSCGQVSTCADCSVPLTYHQQEHLLICHYCGRQTAVPLQCGQCGGEYIYFTGVGTEQLEQIVRSLLPEARLVRADRDTTRRRGALRQMLIDFSEGKLDILLGTQMLAKGHDFPNVTLVGVLSADAGLSFPDFRSAERTFQLLTQVAGRAGRGAAPGRVIVQAYYPDHYALQAARTQDYSRFFGKEIEYRRLLGYPPFRSLIQFLISDTDQGKACQTGEKVAAALKNAQIRMGKGKNLVVLGPAPAPIEKLRGRYRVQILLKCDQVQSVLPVMREAFITLAEKKVAVKNVHVDVDPLSML